MDVTPNFGFQLLEPSQSQPEVPLNYDWNKLDTLLAELDGTISVEQFGDSPALTGIRKLIFQGATITSETNGAALVAIDASSGSPGSGGSPISVTDGVTTVTDVTEISFTGATVTDLGSGHADVEIGSGGGGGGVALPGQIDDLVYWFKADFPKVSSGNPLASLPNSCPWNLGLVPTGSGATRSATPLNSLEVVDLASSNYSITSGITLKASTLFLVHKPASIAGINQSWTNDSTTNALQVYLDTSGHLSIGVASVALVGASSIAQTAAWYQANCTYDSVSGAYAFRSGQTSGGSGTNAHTVTGANRGILSDNSGGSPATGSVAELIIYNRVLSGPEIASVEAYLNAKWGV